MSDQTHEDLARLRKAIAIADVAWECGWGYDPGRYAVHGTEHDWETIRLLADVPAPSPETRDLVIVLLDERKERSRRVAALRKAMEKRT